MKPSLTPINRRHLIRGTVAAGTALVAGQPRTQVAAAELESLGDAKVFLFQGDSITDAGRDRKSMAANDPRSLGRGYPLLIAAGLLADHPTRELKVHNRGISGNKVPDLQNRWQADCIDLAPDVLSILIGVNDIWHKLAGRYDGSVADYQSGLLALLKETRDKLPKTKIVLCEPFVLRCGAVNDTWFPEFNHRREAALEVAAELSLTVVRFQKMFDEALDGVKPGYWAADGVHPTLAGHALMARTWRDTVGV